MIGRSPEIPWGQSSDAGAAAPFEDLGSRPQCRVGIEHAIGEALKEMRVAGADPEMPELHLRLGPSQRGRAVERHGTMMLVHEIERFIA